MTAVLFEAVHVLLGRFEASNAVSELSRNGAAFCCPERLLLPSLLIAVESSLVSIEFPDG